MNIIKEACVFPHALFHYTSKTEDVENKKGIVVCRDFTLRFDKYSRTVHARFYDMYVSFFRCFLDSFQSSHYHVSRID